MAWVMTAISVGTGILGASASASSKQASIAQQKYQLDVQASFGEETIRTERGAVNISFADDFGKRLDGYTAVRDSQLVTAGYQMRTADSLAGIQKADEHHFEYDNKVAELNQNMALASVELNSAMTKMGRQADQQALSMASAATKSAAQWQVASTLTSAATSYAKLSTPTRGTNPATSDGMWAGGNATNTGSAGKLRFD